MIWLSSYDFTIKLFVSVPFQFLSTVSLKFVTDSNVIFSLSTVSGNGNIHDYITRRNKNQDNL